MDALEFKQLIVPLYSGMMALACRMTGGDSDSAADLVQDTVTHLWEKRDTLSAQNVKSLCLVSVRNRCLNKLRNTRPNISLDDAPPLHAPPPADHAHLYEAISRLPDSYRRIISLSLRGYSNQEIASLFNLNTDNVRQLIARGRRRLRIILSEI